MSNCERQRLFRERNPGYYGRLHRKRKAEMLAMRAARLATAAAKQPLMLPAPMEQFMLFDFKQPPGHQRERELVPVERNAKDS